MLEKRPDVQTIMGCLSLWFNPRDCAQHGIVQQHIYRAEVDIAPMSWDELIANKNVGTVGTHSAVRMDLAWKLGFRPDLPAAEFFEFTHCCFASGPYAKIPHPLIVVDRSVNHSTKADDPFVHHGDRLNEAISAISEVWGDRGRIPFTYGELEERWRVRQYRTEDLFHRKPFLELDEFDYHGAFEE